MYAHSTCGGRFLYLHVDTARIGMSEYQFILSQMASLCVLFLSRRYTCMTVIIHVYVYPTHYLFIHPPIHSHIPPSTHSSIRPLSIHPPSTYTSIHPLTHPFVHLFIHLSIHSSTYLPSIHLSNQSAHLILPPPISAPIHLYIPLTIHCTDVCVCVYYLWMHVHMSHFYS